MKSVIVWSFTLDSINRGLFSGEFCLTSGLHVHEPFYMLHVSRLDVSLFIVVLLFVFGAS